MHLRGVHPSPKWICKYINKISLLNKIHTFTIMKTKKMLQHNNNW